MSTQMKLKHEVDYPHHIALNNILDLIDLELYDMLCVEIRNKISAQINFVDDRIAEQLK
jgi:hypothetical protein